jgi:hypothetical protein
VGPGSGDSYAGCLIASERRAPCCSAAPLGLTALPLPPLRSDLEKAIAAHGGPGVAAQRLGWRLKARSRKPRGYWDSLPNVRQEVDEFVEECGLPSGARRPCAACDTCFGVLCFRRRADALPV